MSDPTRVARLFHETYERLAPSFGYETRKASAVPWDDVPENNRRLMIAVAAEILAALSTTPAPDRISVVQDAPGTRMVGDGTVLSTTPAPLDAVRDALTPLLSWAEAVRQHHAMLRSEPPFTTTAKLNAALDAAFAALSTTPAPLDVDTLYRAMVSLDSDDPGAFNIVAISEPDTRPVAAALAEEYDRIAREYPAGHARQASHTALLSKEGAA